MKLYYATGACSLVVRIIINEIGMPCEFEAVDLKSKKTASGTDYLTINPKGSVPVIEIEKNTILTENAVILQYLADTHPEANLLPPIGDFKRYRVLEWLNYITTELHKGFGPLFNDELPQDIKDQFFIPLLKKKFAYINSSLQGRPYLFGDHFTLPDAYLFVMLSWAEKLKLPLDEYTDLRTYFMELTKRKAIEKSLKEEGLI